MCHLQLQHNRIKSVGEIFQFWTWRSFQILANPLTHAASNCVVREQSARVNWLFKSTASSAPRVFLELFRERFRHSKEAEDLAAGRESPAQAGAAGPGGVLPADVARRLQQQTRQPHSASSIRRPLSKALSWFRSLMWTVFHTSGDQLPSVPGRTIRSKQST